MNSGKLIIQKIIREKEQGMGCKLLLFDLDGTLLTSDKTISEVTMQELYRCRQQGIMIGVSTSRSEKNSMDFLKKLNPDVVISSAGALVKYKGEYIYKAEFTKSETKAMIQKAREICGENCEITIDTIGEHYWNYKIDPKRQDKSWGDSLYTDFHNFEQASLKMCVEIFEETKAEILKKELPDCDCAKFSDGYWYKFTKKTATKEIAILHMCKVCGITTDEIVAFGDDYADIGMLKLCGSGIAMGNAINEVKRAADCVIGDNDHDGIGYYLQNNVESVLDDFTVREAGKQDLDEILRLYLYLHETTIPEKSEQLRKTWESIIKDQNHHLIICESDNKIVASCVCVVIPNLTRNVRPYAFVENVVTHADYRKKGYATACLNYAKDIAEKNNCYKMMLLTGSKEESILNFYRNAGYNSSDKTAFIQWLNM